MSAQRACPLPRWTLCPDGSFPTRARAAMTAAEVGAPPTWPITSPAPSQAMTSTRSVDIPRCLQATPSQSKRSEEHTSELQSPDHLVCRLLLEKKKTTHHY